MSLENKTSLYFEQITPFVLMIIIYLFIIFVYFKYWYIDKASVSNRFIYVMNNCPTH